MWYYKKNNENYYLYNQSTDINAPKENITADNPEGNESNILFVKGNRKIYCDKTADELIEMGVIR